MPPTSPAPRPDAPDFDKVDAFARMVVQSDDLYDEDETNLADAYLALRLVSSPEGAGEREDAPDVIGGGVPSMPSFSEMAAAYLDEVARDTEDPKMHEIAEHLRATPPAARGDEEREKCKACHGTGEVWAGVEALLADCTECASPSSSGPGGDK